MQHRALPLAEVPPAREPADLVLHKPRGQLGIQLDVSTPVTALFVIVGGREDGDHLPWETKKLHWPQQLFLTLTSEPDLRKNSRLQNYVSTCKTMSFTQLLLAFESELWAFSFDLSDFREQ